MTATQVLPVASAGIIILFALLVFRRYAQRGGTHLLLWGIGLALFGVGSLTEAYSAIGWHPAVFRLWYLGGAILNAAWLGQGTVYLLAGQRLPNILTALLLGYAAAAVLFLGLGAALGRSGVIVAALIAFHGVIFTLVIYRRWARRWSGPRLAGVLTGFLIAGSLAATYLIFAVPLNAAGFDPAQPLSGQYREILPAGALVRRLTPIFNIYGTIALVGGALYSAWLLWRKEIMPHRVYGNILIAGGALAIAFASTQLRLGLADFLYVAELVAAMLMFAGFLLATARVPASAAAPTPVRVESSS